MSSRCLFCEIVSGSEPGHEVFRDDVAVGFLDIRPVFKGHVLVVPTRHAVVLTDLADDELGPYFTRVRMITAAVEAGLGAQGSFVALNNRVSQSVAHLHTHVVPRTKGDGLRGFFWPRVKYTDEAETAAYADLVRSALKPA